MGWVTQVLGSSASDMMCQVCGLRAGSPERGGPGLQPCMWRSRLSLTVGVSGLQPTRPWMLRRWSQPGRGCSGLGDTLCPLPSRDPTGPQRGRLSASPAWAGFPTLRAQAFSLLQQKLPLWFPFYFVGWKRRPPPSPTWEHPALPPPRTAGRSTLPPQSAVS